MAFSTYSARNPFGFSLTPWVKRLIIANAVVFVLTLAFSALIPLLALVPAALLTRPWTLLTYMFVHAGFLHLLFNMLGLFFFGPPLEERWGSNEFLKFYLVCGAGGALLSLMFPHQMIVGASGAVFGTLLAYAMYWPDNPIYIYGIFPVKAKFLVAFFIGITLFYALFGGGGNVAHLAHLGGAAAAFLYLKSSWGPSPWGPRTPVAPKPPVVSRAERALKSLRRRESSVPKSEAAGMPPVREGELLDEIDRILDKISAKGIESLTSEERSRLDEVSRRYRTH